MIPWMLLAALSIAAGLLSFSATFGWRRRRWFRRHRTVHLNDEATNEGLCPLSGNDLRFPLSGCRLGQAVCLQCLEVDHCVLHRLRELGLTPGVELSVVQDSGGPLLVSVRGSRVALGRDLADSLYVISTDSIPVVPTVADEGRGS